MKTENIIGTDASLNECRSEGYLMMDTEGHRELKRDYSYRIFAYYPEYFIAESRIKKDSLRIDTTYSWNDILERYSIPKYKEGIDKFADYMSERMQTKNPSFYDLLSACDSVNAYCGLE